MSGYLSHLAALTLNQAEPVQPRLASRFEAPCDGDNKGSVGDNGDNHQQTADATVPTLQSQAPIEPISKPVMQYSMPAAPGAKQELNGGDIEANISADKKLATKNIEPPNQQLQSAILFAAKPEPLNPEPLKRVVEPIKPVAQLSNSAKDFRPEQAIKPIEHIQERLIETRHSEVVIKEIAAGDNFQEVNRWQELPKSTPVKPATISVRSEQIVVTPTPLATQAGAASASADADVPATPTIQVTIGRIEIRATQTADKPAAKTRSAPTTMSLDDYLKQRNGGRS